jgi:hypothetical protein
MIPMAEDNVNETVRGKDSGKFDNDINESESLFARL